mgnify:CR=1 FL=1
MGLHGPLSFKGGGGGPNMFEIFFKKTSTSEGFFNKEISLYPQTRSLGLGR